MRLLASLRGQFELWRIKRMFVASAAHAQIARDLFAEATRRLLAFERRVQP